MKSYRTEAEFNAAWGDTAIMGTHPSPAPIRKPTGPLTASTSTLPALILVAACVVALAYSVGLLYLRLKGG